MNKKCHKDQDWFFPIWLHFVLRATNVLSSTFLFLFTNSLVDHTLQFCIWCLSLVFESADSLPLLLSNFCQLDIVLLELTNLYSRKQLRFFSCNRQPLPPSLMVQFQKVYPFLHPHRTSYFNYVQLENMTGLTYRLMRDR